MVRIRMRRDGAKNSPYYRIVVADGRSPRDGKFIELIGTYDPKKEGVNYKIDLDRAEYWIKHGAQPSETVYSFIRKTRTAAKKAAAAA
jgi:small subunit ribosomal protein S16